MAIIKVFKENLGGDKVFCILADTGMGKTTAMVNLFCDYVYRYKAGTLPYEIRLFSFSDPNIFEKINAIEDKQNCILLLDAVDESLKAQNDATYPTFLQKLEATYEQFARVVTTCRPQFFTSSKSTIVELADWIARNDFHGNPFEGATIHRFHVEGIALNYDDMMLVKAA